jgi:hypothetical protein
VTGIVTNRNRPSRWSPTTPRRAWSRSSTSDVEEIELDAWNELEINPVDPPEDWSGPFDGIGREEMGDVETAVFNGSIDNVLDDLDRND